MTFNKKLQSIATYLKRTNFKDTGGNKSMAVTTIKNGISGVFDYMNAKAQDNIMFSVLRDYYTGDEFIAERGRFQRQLNSAKDNLIGSMENLNTIYAQINPNEKFFDTKDIDGESKKFILECSQLPTEKDIEKSRIHASPVYGTKPLYDRAKKTEELLQNINFDNDEETEHQI